MWFLKYLETYICFVVGLEIEIETESWSIYIYIYIYIVRERISYNIISYKINKSISFPLILKK